jgi:hypothetical protein
MGGDAGSSGAPETKTATNYHELFWFLIRDNSWLFSYRPSLCRRRCPLQPTDYKNIIRPFDLVQ